MSSVSIIQSCLSLSLNLLSCPGQLVCLVKRTLWKLLKSFVDPLVHLLRDVFSYDHASKPCCPPPSHICIFNFFSLLHSHTYIQEEEYIYISEVKPRGIFCRICSDRVYFSSKENIHLFFFFFLRTRKIQELGSLENRKTACQYYKCTFLNTSNKLNFAHFRFFFNFRSQFKSSEQVGII